SNITCTGSEIFSCGGATTVPVMMALCCAGSPINNNVVSRRAFNINQILARQIRACREIDHGTSCSFAARRLGKFLRRAAVSLLFIGIHNAWDSVLYIALERRPTTTSKEQPR